MVQLNEFQELVQEIHRINYKRLYGKDWPAMKPYFRPDELK